MPTEETYLITWTTYGTWLPGDPRGYSTRSAKDTFRGPDSLLHQWSRQHLAGPPVQLNNEQVACVCDVVRELFEADRRLMAASVAAMHCHLVAQVTADEVAGLMNIIKGRSSHRLRGFGLEGKKWAEKYHAGSLRDGKAIEEAIAYVRSHVEQGALIVVNSEL